MKCLYCNGTGDITKNNEKFRQTNRIKLSCPHCRGTGIEPLTNDEWRKTCSAEEFAKWLSDIIFDNADAISECRDKDCRSCKIGWCDKVNVIEWLKEKHIDG